MANDRPSLCPFEVRHSKYRIACEGVGEGETLLHDFTTKEQAIAWRMDFCADWCYTACPYYQFLMGEKYADSQED